MNNTLDKQYTDLLQDILDNGVTKQDRTGTGTISVFGRQIRHKMSEGFPLLTTKKMPFKTIVTELLWFLRGDTNIKFLVDNNCHIWDGDCYQAYVKKHKHAIRTEGNRSEIAIESLEKQLIYTQEEFINKIKTDDEFAKKWGELGPIYGKQWRSWAVPRMEPKGFDFDTAWEKSQELWKSSNGMECGPSFETFCMSLLRSKKMGIAYGYHTQIDQIANLINDLKTNPDSRRLLVSAWNPAELDQMVLPPCHYGFQVYTRELTFKEKFLLWNKKHMPMSQHTVEDITMFEKHTKEENEKIFIKHNIPTRAISLMWNQRSCDLFLGIPFNIASYGLLLEIIAKEVNMVPDELIGNLGDVHLYANHVEQAKEQIEREPYELPALKIHSSKIDNIAHHEITDFEIENYQSHPAIKAPLSN
jgi:thymidylate synthase